MQNMNYYRRAPFPVCLTICLPMSPHMHHCEKAFVITIAFVTRVATVRIVPCGSQLWAIQHTWSTGTAEVVQGLGGLLRHQINAIHNKRALFPCKEP